jgi:hypothetical protein
MSWKYGLFIFKYNQANNIVSLVVWLVQLYNIWSDFNADFVHFAWYVDKKYIVYILNTARIFHSRFTCNIYNTQNLDTKQICCLETALLFRPHKINIEILYFIKYYNAFEKNNFKWNPPVVDLKVKLWTDDAEPLVARDCGALNLLFS